MRRAQALPPPCALQRDQRRPCIRVPPFARDDLRALTERAREGDAAIAVERPFRVLADAASSRPATPFTSTMRPRIIGTCSMFDAGTCWVEEFSKAAVCAFADVDEIKARDFARARRASSAWIAPSTSASAIEQRLRDADRDDQRRGETSRAARCCSERQPQPRVLAAGAGCGAAHGRGKATPRSSSEGRQHGGEKIGARVFCRCRGQHGRRRAPASRSSAATGDSAMGRLRVDFASPRNSAATGIAMRAPERTERENQRDQQTVKRAEGRCRARPSPRDGQFDDRAQRLAAAHREWPRRSAKPRTDRQRRHRSSLAPARWRRRASRSRPAPSAPRTATRLRSTRPCTALATPAPPATSAVSATSVSICDEAFEIARELRRHGVARANLPAGLRKGRLGRFGEALHLLVADISVQRHARHVPHDGAGRHQPRCGRARRASSSRAGRSRRRPASLSGSLSSFARGFDSRVADDQPVAELHVEPREQDRIDDDAEDAVLLGQRFARAASRGSSANAPKTG